ncbi:hypothetical protein PMAYCL1PPCAC_15165, partial [Pristionchus mayeri]
VISIFISNRSFPLHLHLLPCIYDTMSLGQSGLKTSMPAFVMQSQTDLAACVSNPLSIAHFFAISTSSLSEGMFRLHFFLRHSPFCPHLTMHPAAPRPASSSFVTSERSLARLNIAVISLNPAIWRFSMKRWGTIASDSAAHTFWSPTAALTHSIALMTCGLYSMTHSFTLA